MTALRALAAWVLVAALAAPAAAEEPAVVPPRLVTFADAELPADAMERAPEDVDELRIRLRLTVDAEGQVTEVTLDEGVGDPFDAAAVAACERFVFEPATHDGEPVAVVVPYTYVFEIVRPEPEPEPAPEPLPTGVVTGKVEEAGTRAPLIGIMVLLRTRHSGPGRPPPARETVTDAEGAYRFEHVPDGAYEVQPAAQDDKQPVYPITVEDGATYELPTLHAPAGRVKRYETVIKAEPSAKAVTRVRLSEPEVKTVPGTFGDPTRVVATLPGVARTAFGLPYYVVRGGGFENTGMLIDGFPVPLLYHLFAGPAVLDPELIGGLDFYPGGFPVEYGRYSAGLLDVTTKDPGRDTWHVITAIDLFKASVLASIPFDEGKGILSFGARGSWIGAVVKAVDPNAGVDLFYWDYQVRLTYDFTPRTSLTVSFLGAGDHILAKDQGDGPSFEDTPAGRAELAPMFHRAHVRLSHQLTPSVLLRSDTLAGFDGQKFVAKSPGSPELRFESDSLILGQRLGLFVRDDDSGHAIAAGIDFDATHLVGRLVFPGLQPLASYPLPSEKPGADTSEFRGRVRFDEWNTALWADFTYELAEGFTIVPGLRLDLFHINEHTHLRADPRVTVRAEVLPWLTVKAATGLFHQPAEAFQLDETFGEPSLGPLRAWQSSGGVELGFGEDDEWQVHLTGFYNRMYDLPIWSGDVAQDDDEGKLSQATYVNEGDGRSYGLEVFFRKRVGDHVFGWLSYTFSRAERRPLSLSAELDADAASLDQDGWGVFAMDQSHVLNLAWTVLLPWNVSIGARFTLATGRPGPRITGAYYDVDADRYEPIIEGTERMPIFHQLDLRIDKRFVFTTWMIELYIDIQNVYFQDNAEAFDYRFDYSSRQVVGGVPILPTIGFKCVF